MRVTFKDQASVIPALKKISGSFWQGRMIRAAPSMRLPNPKRGAPSKIIFVDRLPRDATDEELNEAFADLPYHPRIRLTENEYGGFRGIAYIHFKSVDQAEHAMKLLIGRKCRGRYIFFDYANPNMKRRYELYDKRQGPADRSGKLAATLDIADAEQLKKELEDMDVEDDLKIGRKPEEMDDEADLKVDGK